MGPTERAAFDAVVGDLVRHTPDILVVESRERSEAVTGYPGGFDHLAYYGMDPAFARCLMEFHVTASLREYDVLRRQPVGLYARDCADGG
jgi:hypothetical protein